MEHRDSVEMSLQAFLDEEEAKGNKLFVNVCYSQDLSRDSYLERAKSGRPKELSQEYKYINLYWVNIPGSTYDDKHSEGDASQEQKDEALDIVFKLIYKRENVSTAEYKNMFTLYETALEGFKEAKKSYNENDILTVKYCDVCDESVEIFESSENGSSPIEILDTLKKYIADLNVLVHKVQYVKNYKGTYCLKLSVTLEDIQDGLLFIFDKYKEEFKDDKRVPEEITSNTISYPIFEISDQAGNIAPLNCVTNANLSSIQTTVCSMMNNYIKKGTLKWTFSALYADILSRAKACIKQSQQEKLLQALIKANELYPSDDNIQQEITIEDANGKVYELDANNQLVEAALTPGHTYINDGEWTNSKDKDLDIRIRLGYDTDGNIQFKAYGINNSKDRLHEDLQSKQVDVAAVAKNIRDKSNAFFSQYNIKELDQSPEDVGLTINTDKVDYPKAQEDQEAGLEIIPINTTPKSDHLNSNIDETISTSETSTTEENTENVQDVANYDLFPDGKGVEVKEEHSLYALLCKAGNLTVELMKTGEINQEVYDESDAMIKVSGYGTGAIQGAVQVVTDITSGLKMVCDIIFDKAVRDEMIAGMKQMLETVADDPKQLIPMLKEMFIGTITGLKEEQVKIIFDSNAYYSTRGHYMVFCGMNLLKNIFAGKAFIDALPKFVKKLSATSIKGQITKGVNSFKNLPTTLKNLPAEKVRQFSEKLGDMQDQMKEALESFKNLKNVNMKKYLIENKDSILIWLRMKKKRCPEDLLESEGFFDRLKKHNCN